MRHPVYKLAHLVHSMFPMVGRRPRSRWLSFDRGGLWAVAPPDDRPRVLPTRFSCLRRMTCPTARFLPSLIGPQVTVEPGPLRALLCHWYNTILFLPKTFCGPTTQGPRRSGAPVRWTAWNPGFYATVRKCLILLSFRISVSIFSFSDDYFNAKLDRSHSPINSYSNFHFRRSLVSRN